MDNIAHSQDLNPEPHKAKKRNVAGAYSMPVVLKNESKIDTHVSELMEQFKRQEGGVFDIAPWTQFAAFDIAMDMAFSEPVGFIRSGYDVDNLIRSLHQLLVGANVTATFPIIADIVYTPFVFKVR